MATQALAIKYRPKTWEDVTEQNAIRVILENQINTNTIKHGYLFVGPAGCGKTTSARIFANYINKGEGNTIELDAASNNSVDDIRKLTEDAQTKPLVGEYKVFILDEVHVLSSSAWQALLKTLEEPPIKSIFILCTTNPEKIPKTILSRVQRYNFQRISSSGIVLRLKHIIDCENNEGVGITYTEDALEMISKMADGGMRDAITLMDKCLSFSNSLTLETCVTALGVEDYDTMLQFIDCAMDLDRKKDLVDLIENIYHSGADLKLFIKQVLEFTLDIIKMTYGCDKQFVSFPLTDNIKKWAGQLGDNDFNHLDELLELLVRLNSEIKYIGNPKYYIESTFMVR